MTVMSPVTSRQTSDLTCLGYTTHFRPITPMKRLIATLSERAPSFVHCEFPTPDMTRWTLTCPVSEGPGQRALVGRFDRLQGRLYWISYPYHLRRRERLSHNTGAHLCIVSSVHEYRQDEANSIALRNYVMASCTIRPATPGDWNLSMYKP